MTAEQELSFSNSLHNFQHQDVNVDTELVHWAQGEMQEKMNLEAVTSKKRMWQLIEEEAEQHSLTLPLKKSPRKNEDQGKINSFILPWHSAKKKELTPIA
jgi:hypothetical protein